MKREALSGKVPQMWLVSDSLHKGMLFKYDRPRCLSGSAGLVQHHIQIEEERHQINCTSCSSNSRGRYCRVEKQQIHLPGLSFFE